MKCVRGIVCCLVCAMALLGVSCGKEPLPVAEVLSRLEEVTGDLPAGARYCSDAEEGEAEAMPSDLRNALFGEESERIFSTVEEYAMYLSWSATPTEMAVFRCYSATDAHRVALMCTERIEELRIALRGTEWESLATDAVVICRRRDVLLCITDCARSVEKKADRLLG